MSRKPSASSTNDFSEEQIAKFEERLMQLTPAFPYPVTPDIAGQERLRLEAKQNTNIPKRRLAIGLVVLFIALAAALLITPVRAQILDWFRIGSVKIFLLHPHRVDFQWNTDSRHDADLPWNQSSIWRVRPRCKKPASRQIFRSLSPPIQLIFNDPDKVFVQTI